MSIKPWQEREASDDWVPADQQTAMQSEIDELRAALAERDAEISEYRDDVASLNALVAEQRRVLEQAHKALNVAVIQNGCDMIMTGEELRKCEAAITAIKEQLK